jgi:hypothetical protein
MALLDTGERRSRGGRDRPAGDPHTAAYHFQLLSLTIELKMKNTETNNDPLTVFVSNNFLNQSYSY